MQWRNRGGRIMAGIFFGLVLMAFSPVYGEQPTRTDSRASAPIPPKAALVAKENGKAAPVAVISGKDTLGLGEPASYSSEGSSGATYRWIVIPSKAEKWCFFGLFPKSTSEGEFIPGVVIVPKEKCTITLLLFMIQDNSGAIAQKEITVAGGDPTPPPSPPPGPVNPPAPPQPTSDNELTKWVIDSVPQMVTTDASSRSRVAGKLAEAMNAVCKLIADNPSNYTMEAARELLARKTYEAVSTSEQKDWGAFSRAMDSRIKPMVTTGQIKSPVDYVKLAWKPIADGLMSIAGITTASGNMLNMMPLGAP